MLPSTLKAVVSGTVVSLSLTASSPKHSRSQGHPSKLHPAVPGLCQGPVTSQLHIFSPPVFPSKSSCTASSLPQDIDASVYHGVPSMGSLQGSLSSTNRSGTESTVDDGDSGLTCPPGKPQFFLQGPLQMAFPSRAFPYPSRKNKLAPSLNRAHPCVLERDPRLPQSVRLRSHPACSRARVGPGELDAWLAGGLWGRGRVGPSALSVDCPRTLETCPP